MTSDCWLLMLPDNTRQGKLRDYVDQNSCLTFGPDTPTINPYTHSTSLDVFDFPSSVYLFLCSALSSEHLPIIIDFMCRSPFLQTKDRTEFRPIGRPTSRLTWKKKIQSSRIYKKWWQSTHAL